MRQRRNLIRDYGIANSAAPKSKFHSLSPHFPPCDISTMDLRRTPQTIMIYKGEVVHNWSGAYQRKVRDSIQRILAVSLPEFTKIKLGGG
jgi:hypothetical protein